MRNQILWHIFLFLMEKEYCIIIPSDIPALFYLYILFNHHLLSMMDGFFTCQYSHYVVICADITVVSVAAGDQSLTILRESDEHQARSLSLCLLTKQEGL